MGKETATWILPNKKEGRISDTAGISCTHKSMKHPTNWYVAKHEERETKRKNRRFCANPKFLILLNSLQAPLDFTLDERICLEGPSQQGWMCILYVSSTPQSWAVLQHCTRRGSWLPLTEISLPQPKLMAPISSRYVWILPMQFTSPQFFRPGRTEVLFRYLGLHLSLKQSTAPSQRAEQTMGGWKNWVE